MTGAAAWMEGFSSAGRVDPAPVESEYSKELTALYRDFCEGKMLMPVYVRRRQEAFNRAYARARAARQGLR